MNLTRTSGAVLVALLLAVPTAGPAANDHYPSIVKRYITTMHSLKSVTVTIVASAEGAKTQETADFRASQPNRLSIVTTRDGAPDGGIVSNGKLLWEWDRGHAVVRPPMKDLTDI